MNTHRLSLQRPLAVLDLETTGVNILQDRIVEIAILVLRPDGGTASLTRRVNPEMPIPPDATAIHGIGDADVALEPTFGALAPLIRDTLRGCDLSGYNIRRFDLPLLRNEFARVREEFDLGDAHVVDVQTIFHSREPRDLSAALRYYCAREHEGAHGALADVQATADILRAQLERYADLPGTIAELEAAVHPRNPSWIDDEGKLIWEQGEAVFTFGRHRGKTLRAVAEHSPDYLDWIVANDFPAPLKTIVTAARHGSFPAAAPSPGRNGG